MRVFEVLFWCAPQNNIFLVVSELPVEKRKEIQKSAINAPVLFGGFGRVRFSIVSSLLGIYPIFSRFFFVCFPRSLLLTGFCHCACSSAPLSSSSSFFLLLPSYSLSLILLPSSSYYYSCFIVISFFLFSP